MSFQSLSYKCVRKDNLALPKFILELMQPASTDTQQCMGSTNNRDFNS